MILIVKLSFLYEIANEGPYNLTFHQRTDNILDCRFDLTPTAGNKIHIAYNGERHCRDEKHICMLEHMVFIENGKPPHRVSFCKKEFSGIFIAQTGKPIKLRLQIYPCHKMVKHNLKIIIKAIPI